MLVEGVEGVNPIMASNARRQTSAKRESSRPLLDSISSCWLARNRDFQDVDEPGMGFAFYRGISPTPGSYKRKAKSLSLTTVSVKSSSLFDRYKKRPCFSARKKDLSQHLRLEVNSAFLPEVFVTTSFFCLPFAPLPRVVVLINRRTLTSFPF